MKRTLITATALAAATTVALVAPVAASARTVHPHVSASQSTTVIHSGSRATISGSVSPNARGHHVYLQKYWSKRWHNVTYRTLNSASRYSFTVAPTARGTASYRVFDTKMKGHTSAVSRTIRIRVETRGSITLRSYSSRGSSEWQGSTVRIPTADYAVAYRLTCAQDDYSPFMDITWNSGGYQQEYLFFAPRHGAGTWSGTWYGHAGARSGYFEMGTQLDCTWSARVSYTAWR